MADMFLKVDGIEGESVDVNHSKEFDLESWSWGMTQTGSTHIGGGSGTGKVNVQDLHFTKRQSKASPVMALHCCNGKHIKKATLVQRKAGEKPMEFIKLEIEDLIVTSFQTGSHGEVPVDSFSFNFAKFKYVYAVQKVDGSRGPESECAWNIAGNGPA